MAGCQFATLKKYFKIVPHVFPYTASKRTIAVWARPLRKTPKLNVPSDSNISNTMTYKIAAKSISLRHETLWPFNLNMEKLIIKTLMTQYFDFERNTWMYQHLSALIVFNFFEMYIWQNMFQYNRNILFSAHNLVLTRTVLWSAHWYFGKDRLQHLLSRMHLLFSYHMARAIQEMSNVPATEKNWKIKCLIVHLIFHTLRIYTRAMHNTGVIFSTKCLILCIEHRGMTLHYFNCPSRIK